MGKRVTRDAIRKFIRQKLKAGVQTDKRLHAAYENHKLTEATFQTIISDHLSRFVGNSWIVASNYNIPGLRNDNRTDIALFKLTKDGSMHKGCGVIAIELKAKGAKKKLKEDLEKLSKYLKRVRTGVNFGVLIYFSPMLEPEKELRKIARKRHEHNLEVIRVYVQGDA